MVAAERDCAYSEYIARLILSPARARRSCPAVEPSLARGFFAALPLAEVRQMEDMNQLETKFRRAEFRNVHPVIVTEQHADPVELVFQAFLRLDREQRARLVQRLK
jgi:hypothetical protein